MDRTGMNDQDSTNIRDFFKRPENEDTLHFLKRQHQEQMKKMEELDKNSVSPLKLYNSNNHTDAKNNNSNNSDNLLRQQLRGEMPLPSSSSTNFNSNLKVSPNIQYPRSSSSSYLQKNSRIPHLSPNFNNNSVDSDSYIKSLLNEIELLKEMVYQQQSDIQLMKNTMDNEKLNNFKLLDKMVYLENNLQMLQLNSKMKERTYTALSNDIPSNFSDSNLNYNEYSNGNNISNNNLTQNYRNQEFISSPTSARPFSIVDDKTTNLLFSEKRH